VIDSGQDAMEVTGSLADRPIGVFRRIAVGREPVTFVKKHR